MPDFMMVLMQQCTRVVCESPKWRDRGGCWPYLRSKKGFVHGQCKHMCGWHQFVGPETQTKEQAEMNVCPRCGAHTETVQFAV